MLHAVLQLVEPRVDLGVEIGGRDHHLEFALEAFGRVSVTCIDSHSSFRCALARRRPLLVDGRCPDVMPAESPWRGAGGGT